MPHPTTQAFVLGVVSGMRAALGPALVSHRLSGSGSADLGRLNFMRSPTAAAILKVAAAGELVGDKLPMTPARVEPGPLLGRALSGALCGAVLGRSAPDNSAIRRSARRKGATGAVIGALGAVVGAYAFYALRRELTQGGLPDVAVALAEDALAVTGGLAGLERS